MPFKNPGIYEEKDSRFTFYCGTKLFFVFSKFLQLPKLISGILFHNL
jgi:hypothetical protein